MNYREYEERNKRMLLMKKQGFTWQQIGKHFGFSAERARQIAVKHARIEYHNSKAGPKYCHKDAGLWLFEILALLPVMDLLKEVANDPRA
jgi:hypothetical protein